MKFFHTADWHLGKIVQGIRMTDDQHYILEQFIEYLDTNSPDALIIAGDLYDRQIPPTEAVQLLNDILEEIVLNLKIPVLAIAGNHDSPSRLNFANKMMEDQGLYLIGQLRKEMEPVVLQDEFGEVHFHLIPYVEPTEVSHLFDDPSIKTHHDAYETIIQKIKQKIDENARHVFVGHAFVTSDGEKVQNTSDSERPLSIGGIEYVNANLFSPFHYTALGHLHRSHYVKNERIRYAGSILKYSISEENHKKGFLSVQMDELGDVSIEKINLLPERDMRTVKGKMEQLLSHEISDDYVFIHLLDETTVLSPMEKIRSVYPNALHIKRENIYLKQKDNVKQNERSRNKMSELELFEAFYKEVKGIAPPQETKEIFNETIEAMLQEERK